VRAAAATCGECAPPVAAPAGGGVALPGADADTAGPAGGAGPAPARVSFADVPGAVACADAGALVKAIAAAIATLTARRLPKIPGN
jgi:hypothetical protein